MLNQLLFQLGKPVRIVFFDFSSTFNTIQLMLLGHKLERTGIDHWLDPGLSFEAAGVCESLGLCV